jgi:hypothetical protein
MTNFFLTRYLSSVNSSYFTGGLTGGDGDPGSLAGGSLGTEGVVFGAAITTSNHPMAGPEHSRFVLQALKIQTYLLFTGKS